MDQLLQYLKDVATLECQLYTQNKLLNQIYSNSETLGHPAAYHEPELKPWHPDIGDIVKFSITTTFWLTLIISTAYLVSGKLFEKTDTITSLIFPIFIVSAALRLAIYDYGGYLSEKERYKRALYNYRVLVQNDEIRVSNELIIRKRLVDQWNDVNFEYNKTKQALDKIYAINLIHSKYHNIVAITSFYDYFDTGRCLKLTGPGGAYATFEEDLRFQRIENRLDVIITKLDEIIENQRLIAGLMQEANSALRRIEATNNSMVNSISRIEQNSDLIEYNTRCSARSSAIMENIMVYQMIYHQ